MWAQRDRSSRRWLLVWLALIGAGYALDAFVMHIVNAWGQHRTDLDAWITVILTPIAVLLILVGVVGLIAWSVRALLRRRHRIYTPNIV